MRKADFEKNVQEKMQELRFPPSDEVWKRVQAGIEKKRRRRAFLWSMSSVAFVIIVVCYFMNLSPTARYANFKSDQPGQSIAKKKTSSQQKDARKEGTLITGLPSVQKNNSSTPGKKLPVQDAQVFTNAVSKNSLNDREKKSNRSKESHVRELTPAFQVRKNLIREPIINPVSDLPYSNPIQHYYGFIMPVALEQKVASKSDVKSHENLPAISRTKKDKWEYGISFSTGLSNLGNRLLISDSLQQMYAAPSSGGSVTMGHSGMKNGLAFSIGGTISKWLGSKLKLGFGLQYQYFSNSINVGDKVDSAIFLMQTNSANVLSVSGYYKSYGDKRYHNQYHFISLPVILNWHFSSRFSWENEAVYSRLIATNGLHFDRLNGAYYKDRSLFNNNQFFITTALLYGWNNNKIEVGPQLQYAFTNLISTGAPKSLRSVGIKANMRLSKN